MRVSTDTTKILFAEDNLINQMLVRVMLRRARLSAKIVPNGAEAVALAHTADLILMDCHMPIMDGLEATRRIRSAGMTVPILALTADALEENRASCLAAGMDAVLYKPIQHKQLLEAIAAHLPTARGRSA